jgi:hypothetical protein
MRYVTDHVDPREILDKLMTWVGWVKVSIVPAHAIFSLYARQGVGRNSIQSTSTTSVSPRS